MSLRIELGSLAHQAGGSFKTRADRKRIAFRFYDVLRNKLNIQIRTISQIKIKYIEMYIALRQEEGITTRTLQNEMAGLRSVLIKADRADFVRHERLSNKALGLAGASRQGTKSAITAERYREVLHDALLRDKAFAACLMLGKHLGLRSEEIVQSNKSLQTWLKNLTDGKNSIHVIYGTKTGRARDVTIHLSKRSMVTQAVKFACRVAESQGGKLIDKPTLKAAMDRFHNQARAFGLVGKNSPHSLRYAFAQDQLREYILLGYSRDEALAATSLDLGHGDGRGYFVEHVYTK